MQIIITIETAWPKTLNSKVKCTLCLKKVPTFKLSVNLSNLNRFFKIFALLESV